VQAVALDEETKQIYRGTDSATLLALLPELRRLSVRTVRQLDHVEELLQRHGQSMAEIAELQGESLAGLDARVDPEDAADRESLRQLRDRMMGLREDASDTGKEDASDTGKEQDFSHHLFAYATTLMERERWIRNELKRRGLIPPWPGELEYLDEDA
jgi:hypothetical protein